MLNLSNAKNKPQPFVDTIHILKATPMSFVSLQCFAVRSLGWVEMAEEDLAPGKSSVAVNNCIRQLSYCKNDIRDTVGIWGEVRNFSFPFLVAPACSVFQNLDTAAAGKEEQGWVSSEANCSDS